jgi:serine protease Do
LVTEIQPDGPASRAGIAPGDVVLPADGQPIPNGVDLAAKIGQMTAGTAVKIDIFREGSERTVSAPKSIQTGMPPKRAWQPETSFSTSRVARLPY